LRFARRAFSYVAMRMRAVLLVTALLVSGCRARALSGEPPPAATRLHVAIINGGANKAQNYQSHFLHVRRLLDFLGREGVKPARIAIFDADGTDPAPDMAVRELQPEADFWLLRGTRLESVLGTQIVYANTELPGLTVAAATRPNIHSWFKKARRELRAGDVLLLYVTDHGSKNAEDTSNNRITLWGAKESLSVSELETDLARLDPGVRVVMLMSQCFSGAFARLLSLHARNGLPRGSVCGYFSVPPDRPAYGCYPENRGKDNVGHSFHFLEALDGSRSLPAAHAEVLFTDRTPDVPIRTSDVYLEQLLDRAASADGKERDALVDELLREAWRDKSTWEPDIRLLDRIAHAFGMFSPRSLAELDQQTKALPDLSEQLKTNTSSWEMALGDLDNANLDRFLTANADWKPRLEQAKLTGLDEPARRGLTGELLAALVPFTHDDRSTDERVHALREKQEKASGASYRMEVRLAAVLRLRAVLSSVAGRVFVTTRARPGERAAYEAIRACEDLHFDAASPPATTTLAQVTEPFPPFEDDVAIARDVLPAWMGINFRQASEKIRKQYDLAEGATTILTVYPGSPAQAAGLEVGDVIIGPPGKPFTEPHQVREWTMRSAVDRPAPLLVRRGDDKLTVTLVPKPYPIRLPELPGPPKIGSAAPAIKLTAYRGTVPDRLGDGTPHILFFWATWCAPCKASLPELLAFEQERHTPVIAITDETAEQLDPFFEKWKEPFPAAVATDDLRRAFQAYAVSGTPTFVLVDGDGNVQSSATGYTPDKGLGIPGWSWTSRPPAP
jgi:thiol-disulfide isomerase/thioredoxin